MYTVENCFRISSGFIDIRFLCLGPVGSESVCDFGLTDLCFGDDGGTDSAADSIEVLKVVAVSSDLNRAASMYSFFVFASIPLRMYDLVPLSFLFVYYLCCFEYRLD